MHSTCMKIVICPPDCSKTSSKSVIAAIINVANQHHVEMHLEVPRTQVRSV